MSIPEPHPPVWLAICVLIGFADAIMCLILERIENRKAKRVQQEVDDARVSIGHHYQRDRVFHDMMGIDKHHK